MTHNINKRLIINNHSYTLLSQSVLKKDNVEIQSLIKQGIDINGISNDGITYSSPISLIGDCKNKNELLKTFILNGSTIDLYGLDEYTLLKRELERCVKVIDISFIFLLLTKGSNPNIPICNSAFTSFLHNIKNDVKNNRKKINTIIYMLICFGANPKQENMHSKNAYEYCKEYNINTNIFQINNITNLKNSSTKLLHCISNIYKINTKHINLNDTKQKELVCNRICNNKYITYNNDTIKNIYNPATLIGNSIKCFCNEEILIYKLESQLWCFHMNEIPNLIYKQKNPWTNTKINKSVIETMYDKLICIPQYTIDDIKQFEYIPKKVTISILTQYLQTIIHTFNTHICIDNISTLPKSELFEIIKSIQQYNIVFTHTLTPDDRTCHMDFYIKWFECIISLLQNNKLSIPILSYICERTLNLYDIVLYIKKIINPEFFSQLRIDIIMGENVFDLDNLREYIGNYYTNLIIDRIKMSNYIDNQYDINMEWLNVLKIIIRNE